MCPLGGSHPARNAETGVRDAWLFALVLEVLLLSQKFLIGDILLGQKFLEGAYSM